MKGVIRKFTIVVPVLALAAAPLLAEVKTRDRSSVKFEGALGRVINFFGGKATREGIEGTTAVKGNRKARFNDSTGQIIDLSEEKVYDLDMKKKTYTVTTFEEMRQKIREEREKARQQAEKEQPKEQQQQPEKPQKEYEVDFDVKDTGQKKSVASYDTHEEIATITVREKGKTLEDGGGIVLTADMWLGPEIPQMKEIAQFDLKYFQQLQEGTGDATMTPQQMATVLASFPGVKAAMERFAKEGGKLKGTALETTSTFEAVKSKEQMQQTEDDQKESGGGGLSGMFAKKLMKKKDQPQQRSTIFTTHHEVLSVATSVDAADVSIPPDFKEKK